MRSGLEGKAWRLAPRTHDNVVGGAPADGHALVRQVRDQRQQTIALLFNRVELGLELFDLLATLLVRLEDPRDISALLLGARRFFAGGVLFALERFDGGDQ